MDYQENDLPVNLKEGDSAILADGSAVRYEESGGARDVMVGDEWTARATLFPGMDYTFDAGGATYRATGTDDGMKVEKI